MKPRNECLSRRSKDEIDAPLFQDPILRCFFSSNSLSLPSSLVSRSRKRGTNGKPSIRESLASFSIDTFPFLEDNNPEVGTLGHILVTVYGLKKLPGIGR